MEQITIIHGWDGSPDEPLHQWLKENLEEQGHVVNIPAMPDPEKPTIEEWVDAVQKNTDFSENTILIGHSIGCQAILRALALSDTPVNEVILIGPWMELNQELIEEEGEEVAAIAKPWIETPIDFEKVKENVNGAIHCIFSDDDYYVPLSQKEFFEEKLNCTSTVLEKQGHFTEEDGVTKLPEVLRLV